MIMNWKELIVSCSRYKNLKFLNDKLFAEHGSFIEGCFEFIDLQTNPPQMYKVTGNRISFLGACEIVSFSLDSFKPSFSNEKQESSQIRCLYNYQVNHKIIK